jgi:predicted PurR-regulated permease PerM
MKSFTLNITLKYFFWVFAVILAGYLSYIFSELILILALSILISLIFDPLIVLVERIGFNRLFSSIVVFTVFTFILYLSLSFIIPDVIVQLYSLEKGLRTFSLPEQINKIEDEIILHLPFISKGTIAHKLESIFSGFIEGSINQLANFISNLFSIIALIVIIPFTTFFIVKDKNRIYKGILNLLPNKYFEMSYWILKRVSQQLGKYVRGWLIDAAFVGIACGLGFYIIGIPYAFALGIIAGLGHLVPYFGPVIGGIPALLISVIQFGNLSALPLILLLILIIYFVDNGFVQPYVFSKSVDMHPLIIILLIVAGSQLFGVLGMLLAVPTATVIRTSAKEIYFAFKNYQISRI